MDFQFLSETVLFKGASAEETEKMLSCMGAEEKNYDKGAVIYHAGDIVHSMGLVLWGCVNVESDDLWGNKSILNHIEKGQIFAETYACIPDEPMMVNVVAQEKSGVLFMNTSRLLSTCPNTCAYHSRLVQNLLSVTARKNLNLSRRILHTSSKSIRGRLISYLSFQAAEQRSRHFTIPFNRQQLADYLGVDRSAMSNELSRMQKDGLLTVNKNTFYLIENGGILD